jgi:hypothetical protein
MFNFISRLRQLKYDAEKEEAMLIGFKGVSNLESEKERRKMSTLLLAIRLSECDEGTPAHILLSHELNCKIARIQSKANYFGTVIVVVCLFLGWALGQWKPLESKTSLDIIANHIKTHDKTKTTGKPEDQITEKLRQRPTPKDIPLNPSIKSAPAKKDKDYAN